MILAIDDDPFRYDGLKRMLAPACVNDAVLRGVGAVLLDYDLDSGDPCMCGVHPEFQKGTEWVPYVAKLGVPGTGRAEPKDEDKDWTRVLVEVKRTTEALLIVLGVDQRPRAPERFVALVEQVGDVGTVSLPRWVLP